MSPLKGSPHTPRGQWVEWGLNPGRREATGLLGALDTGVSDQGRGELYVWQRGAEKDWPSVPDEALGIHSPVTTLQDGD